MFTDQLSNFQGQRSIVKSDMKLLNKFNKANTTVRELKREDYTNNIKKHKKHVTWQHVLN